jgi:alcohol dehydrogenase
MTTAELELTTTMSATLSATSMKALVYHGPSKHSWEDKPRPTIQDIGDAIVRITTSTICGTDLHILKGDLPSVTDGRILGHEGIGVVEQVGTGVSECHVGDKVIISCVTACLKCDFCRKGMYSHCRHGGWILGNTIDGTQAEYVRIPHADGSLYPFPANGDEEAMVMLSDILPTGFECGVLNGQVKPGDTVAIVGAGPVGLAVLLTAQFYSPAAIFMIDLDDKRLAIAKTFGATALINSADGHAAHQVMELTEGAGVDVAVEAVGLPVRSRVLTSSPATSVGRATQPYPPLFCGRPGRLRHGWFVRGRSARRTVHQDGEGRLDSLRAHGFFRNGCVAGAAVRRPLEGVVRQVQPHTV